MRVRRVLSSVRWAFRETVMETEIDIFHGNFKRLCDHCVILNGPNCPRKKQLQAQHETMVAVICDVFIPPIS